MLDIRVDDLHGPEIATLLQEHLDNMHRWSPPESVHALDLDALRVPSITFWSGWADGRLVCCGALKELDGETGEIKSMRTADAARRRGYAARMLEHLLGTARSRRYRQLFLETGSQATFEPARRLYARYGFRECAPFAGYGPDPNSTFMTLGL